MKTNRSLLALAIMLVACSTNSASAQMHRQGARQMEDVRDHQEYGQQRSAYVHERNAERRDNKAARRELSERGLRYDRSNGYNEIQKKEKEKIKQREHRRNN